MIDVGFRALGQMLRRSPVLASAIIVIVGAGCGVEGSTSRADGAARPLVSVSDSSGVSVAKNAGTSCPYRLSFHEDRARTIPSTAEARASFDIGQAGARLLPDGGVLVADGSDRSLGVYGTDGVLLRELLGAGGGPGEVSSAFSFDFLEPDEVLVWDGRQSRMTTVNLEGTVVSESLLTQPLGGGLPALSGQQLVRPVGPDALVMFAPEFNRSDRVFSMRFDVLLRTKDGEVVELGQWEGTPIPMGPRGILIEDPLHRPPAAAVGPSPAHDVVLALNEGPWELHRYDAWGQLRGLIRADIPRVPVDSDVLEWAGEVVRARHADDPPLARAIEQTYARADHPDSVAVIRSVHLDELGRAWVYRTGALGAARGYVDLISAEGEWLGCAPVPDGKIEDVTSRAMLLRTFGALGEPALQVIPYTLQ